MRYRDDWRTQYPLRKNQRISSLTSSHVSRNWTKTSDFRRPCCEEDECRRDHKVPRMTNMHQLRPNFEYPFSYLPSCQWNTVHLDLLDQAYSQSWEKPSPACLRPYTRDSFSKTNHSLGRTSTACLLSTSNNFQGISHHLSDSSCNCPNRQMYLGLMWMQCLGTKAIARVGIQCFPYQENPSPIRYSTEHRNCKTSIEMKDWKCSNTATGSSFSPDSAYSIPRTGTMGMMPRLYSHANTN